VIGAARLKCGEPAAEAGELMWRQVGHSFGDFFNFHVAQYSTSARAWLSDGIAGVWASPPRLAASARLGAGGAFFVLSEGKLSRSPPTPEPVELFHNARLMLGQGTVSFNSIEV